MALLHHAELVPSKVDFVRAWAPSQPWFEGDADATFIRVGAFRFDDPGGEVGVETLLIRAGVVGPVLQVPLTYRNEPFPAAEEWFIGTIEHSVLGTRYCYDAVGDPVYLDELAKATLGGGEQVEAFYEESTGRSVQPPTATVRGSGAAGSVAPSAHDAHAPSTRNDRSSTLVETDGLALLIARLPVLHPLPSQTDAANLSGTWTDQSEPAILALVSLRA